MKVYNDVLSCVDSKEHPFYACYQFDDQNDLYVFVEFCVNYFGYHANLNWIDVSNITDMSSLFSAFELDDDDEILDEPSKECGLIDFDGDISLWDVSNVEDMSYMFMKSYFQGDLSGWDVSNVTDMRYMFAESAFCGDISGWDTGKVEDMSHMFQSSSFKGDIRNWDVHNVLNMSYMFHGCEIARDMVRDWHPHKRCRCHGIFESFNVNDMDNEMDIHPGKKQKVGKVSRSFVDFVRFLDGYEDGQHIDDDMLWLMKKAYGNDADCDSEIRRVFAEYNVEELYVYELSRRMLRTIWDIKKALSEDIPYQVRDRFFWDEFVMQIKSKSDPLYAFHVPDSHEDLSDIIDMVPSDANLNWVDVSYQKSLAEIFANTKFNGDISLWDVSNAKSMRQMFMDSNFNGDISGWDVSNVEDMCDMFQESVFDGDISGWDVGNVESMTHMFENSKFNGDISGWDVKSVRHMIGMFDRSEFTGDISGWNVDNVYPDDIEHIFDECNNIDNHKPRQSKATR